MGKDKLEIPDFLYRGPPDKERTNRLLKQEDHREWVMPRGDYAMAKPPEIETNDAALPVEVHITDRDEKFERREFDNLKSFIDWYDVKKYELNGSIAEEDKTMISLHERAPAAEKVKDILDEPVIEKPTKAKKAKAAKPPQGARVKVDDDPKKSAKVGRGAVVKDSERVAKPRGVNFVRHAVRVNGEQYGSVYKAFVALKLSVAAHTKFRAALKQSKTGKDTYKEKGKDYKFELVEMK